MLDLRITPDFITVDGGEGGTGAAPPEFSTSVGAPLVEGLTCVNRTLVGAGLRDRVRVIASGKVISGFNIVRNLALGADTCNAARAMVRPSTPAQACPCVRCSDRATRSNPAAAADAGAGLYSGAQVQHEPLPDGRRDARPGADGAPRGVASRAQRL